MIEAEQIGDIFDVAVVDLKCHLDFVTQTHVNPVTSMLVTSVVDEMLW